MRHFWTVLLALIVLIPATVIIFVLIAAHTTAMDDFTLGMPMGIREMVSQMALRQVGNDGETESRIYRVIELDPVNEAAWARLCALDRNGDPQTTVTICRKAVALRPAPASFHWLGVALEQTGDSCAAEEAFSSGFSMQRDSSELLRSQGLAALRCGHNGAAVDALEQAEGLDLDPSRARADDPGDEIRDPDRKAADGLLAGDWLQEDSDDLILAYQRAQQPEKAGAVCARVHPNWASCTCDLKRHGVVCTDAAARAIR